MFYYQCTRIRMPGALGPATFTGNRLEYYLQRVRRCHLSSQITELRLQIPRGRYEHFKGGFYEVIDVAALGSNPVVYYRALADRSRHLRPTKEWYELVRSKHSQSRISRFNHLPDLVRRGHYLDTEEGQLYYVLGQGASLPEGLTVVTYRRIGAERDFELTVEPLETFLSHGWERTELGQISQGVSS